MDYKTACSFLISQAIVSNPNGDTFLARLQQGKAPVPGQVTNILLALKIVFERMQGLTSIERELVYSLYQLSFESRERFEAGRKLGVAWPPLLDEDLNRINKAVKSIFAGVWQDQ